MQFNSCDPIKTNGLSKQRKMTFDQASMECQIGYELHSMPYVAGDFQCEQGKVTMWRMGTKGRDTKGRDKH